MILTNKAFRMLHLNVLPQLVFLGKLRTLSQQQAVMTGNLLLLMSAFEMLVELVPIREWHETTLLEVGTLQYLSVFSVFRLHVPNQVIFSYEWLLALWTLVWSLLLMHCLYVDSQFARLPELLVADLTRPVVLSCRRRRSWLLRQKWFDRQFHLPN